MDVSTTPLLLAAVIAFGAGLASVLSPCVLPLIPGYLAFIAGGNTRDPHDDSASDGASSAAAMAPSRHRTTTMTRAASFCAGFSILFVVAGLGVGSLGLGGGRTADVVTFLGGTLIAVFGLLLVWNRPLPGTSRASGLFAHVPAPQSNLGAAGAGAVISLAWVPCIGATLAAILTMATVSGDTVAAGILLVAYAAGLSVPFLALAAGWGRLDDRTSFIRRHSRHINVVAGIVLVGLGLAVASGEMGRLSAWLGGLLPVIL